MSDYKKNILSGLVFLFIGIAVIIAAPLAIKDPQVSAVGPRAFPTFLGWGMILISLALIAQTVWKQLKSGLPLWEKQQAAHGTPRSTEQKKESVRNEARAYAALGIMLVYALLFDRIGYFASTFLAITAYLLLLRVKSLQAYIISYAVGAGIWAAFTYLLSVRLP